jgi:hypothetical protein
MVTSRVVLLVTSIYAANERNLILLEFLDLHCVNVIPILSGFQVVCLPNH